MMAYGALKSRELYLFLVLIDGTFVYIYLRIYIIFVIIYIVCREDLYIVFVCFYGYWLMFVCGV